MRRPHVYERTAPRARSETTLPAVRPADVARKISRVLPSSIDQARAAGLESLVDVLEAARIETERSTGLWGPAGD